jgi:predicted DCC family thiol-disulfide oxidoreductase YuxK
MTCERDIRGASASKENGSLNLSANIPVWLYDGTCVLCSRMVRYTLAHEIMPSIRFVAIQSQGGRKLALAHGVNPDNPESFLFIENGRALARSDGVIALAHHLRGPARAIQLASFLPRAFRDRIYNHIARNRYRIFGRLTKCEVPEEAVRGRFILPERE